MECGETTSEGARRETREEAGVTLSDLNLYAIYDVPRIDQVYMFYRAEMSDESFSVGEESLEVALFDEAELPWSELAFPTIEAVLRQFCEDRPSGQFALTEKTIVVQQGVDI